MLTLQANLQEKECFIDTLYRLFSQSRDLKKKSNFEVLIKVISIQKDDISIIMGDFNALSSNSHI